MNSNAQEVNFNSNGTSPKNFRALKLQRLSILYGIYFSNHMIKYIHFCLWGSTVILQVKIKERFSSAQFSN